MNGSNMQLEKKTPTARALGTITVIKKHCYNLLVGREGSMLIRLQSARFKTIKIYNLTVEMTQWRLRGLCESGVYRLEIV